jgi:hypothetical protein
MKKRKQEEDFNEAAFRVVQQSTAEPIPISTAKKRKNPAAVALGRLGGKKGAKGRMEKMSPERRRQIASSAARTRWAKAKQDEV